MLDVIVCCFWYLQMWLLHCVGTFLQHALALEYNWKKAHKAMNKTYTWHIYTFSEKGGFENESFYTDTWQICLFLNCEIAGKSKILQGTISWWNVLGARTDGADLFDGAVWDLLSLFSYSIVLLSQVPR